MISRDYIDAWGEHLVSEGAQKKVCRVELSSAVRTILKTFQGEMDKLERGLEAVCKRTGHEWFYQGMCLVARTDSDPLVCEYGFACRYCGTERRDLWEDLTEKEKADIKSRPVKRPLPLL